MEDPAIGREVDGYRVLDVLGRGGMGVVYKAEDVALSREVALKRIDPALANDETFLRRFRSEARALARIDSPHIVSVHALRKTDLGLLIVMEYVDGGTLKDRIIAEGAMDVANALPIIDKMLAALEDAHGAGVIHRDIKPHNIMLTQAGGVKVTDFGLAKVHRPDDQKTVTQGVYGTLNYMSPEQVQGLGQVDQRSDIYSLGMTIYEMLAGRLPFDGDSNEFTLMRTIVEEELPPPDRFSPALPQPLVQIVMTALAKDPGHRFQNAGEMRRALKQFEKEHNRGQSSRRESREGRGDRAARSPGAAAARKLQYSVLGVLLLGLFAGGYFAYHQLAGGSPGGDAPPVDSEPVAVTSVLSVGSEPPGATVFLDGRTIGSTPLSEDVAVTGDSLKLRLQKNGYDAVDTTLHVSGGHDLALNVRLAAATSSSDRVEGTDGSGPEGEPVADGEGGRDPGATEGENGSEATNGTSEESDEPARPAQGALRLRVQPTGTVLIDGETRGPGTVELPAGQHTIRFRHPEYGGKDTTVTVEAGQTIPLTCYFEQTIFVNHEGAWGNVWVNGQNTGESTPHTFTRGPGTYRIEFRIRRDGYAIPEGQYSKSVDGQRFESDFTGNSKRITIKATFVETRHALLFRTVERSR